MLLLAALSGIALVRLSPPGQRRFVLLLFLAGLSARIGLSLGLDLAAWALSGGKPVQEGSFDRTRRFIKMPDSDDYSERAYAIAEVAKGNKDPVLKFALTNPYGNPAYLYGLGAFYYLFGFSPFSVKWVNCLFGAMIGPLLFLVGERCLNRAAAKTAAVAAAFFPSLLLWSTANLKEAVFIFLALAAVLLFFRVLDSRGRKRLLCAAAAAAVLGVSAGLRIPFYSVLLGCSGVAALILLATLKRRKKALFAVALALVVLAGFAFRKALPYALWAHAGYEGSDWGDTYHFLPEEHYTATGRVALAQGKLEASLGQVAAWTAKATLHYWGEPFPSKMGEGFKLMVFPQMVFWYLLTPLCLWGIWAGVRSNPAGIFLVLLLAAWTCIGALTSGNVGTVFRFRDMVTPWALLFAAAGFWALLGRPEGEHP